MTVALSRPPTVEQADAEPHLSRSHAQERIPLEPSELTEIDRLFTQLAESADDNERQRRRRRIITACLPIADRIACRFVGRGEPSDDLLQVARIGLIHTVDRYDPGKGHFLAFAVPTIRGELRRYFRDTTWTVRVPRKVQETQLRMRDAVNTLSQRLNRAPTDAELAGELDVDPGELSTSQRANWAYRPVSLDAPLSLAQTGRGETLGSVQGADDPHYSQVEDLMMVQDALAELDPRRRAIIGMIYFDCLTQREVARRFNVSQVQVSRLLSDALARIRVRVCTDVPAALCLLGPLIGGA